jgi:hypothetical protein
MQGIGTADGHAERHRTDDEEPDRLTGQLPVAPVQVTGEVHLVIVSSWPQQRETHSE